MLRTIKASSEIDALFRQGRRFSRQHVMLLVRPTPPGRGPTGRVAFIAGKKLGNAVVRNRCKRVMREAVRRTGGPWRGQDVAIIARNGTGNLSPIDITHELQVLLRHADLLS